MTEYKSAYQNRKGEWVLPQVYYKRGGKKPIPHLWLLADVDANPLIAEACKLDTRIHSLVEEAKKERCKPGYSVHDRFYHYYKPIIVSRLGLETGGRGHTKLRTQKHYNAVYEAIYHMLPCDEVDLYPDGIMPNGMFCPTLQEKYNREYP